MKNCPNCGSPMSDAAMFCTVCGTRYEAAKPAEPAQPVQPVYAQPQQPVYTPPAQPRPQAQPVYTQPQMARPVQPVQSARPASDANFLDGAQAKGEKLVSFLPAEKKKLDLRLVTVVVLVFATLLFSWMTTMTNRLAARSGSEALASISIAFGGGNFWRSIVFYGTVAAAFVTALIPPKAGKVVLKIASFVILGIAATAALSYLVVPKLYASALSYYSYGTGMLRAEGVVLLILGVPIAAVGFLTRIRQWWVYLAVAGAVFITLALITFIVGLAGGITPVGAGIATGLLEAFCYFFPACGLLSALHKEA